MNNSSNSLSSSSSSSSSNSTNARLHGKWRDSPHCLCEKCHWRCYHIHHQVVPMVENCNDSTILKYQCLKLRTECKNCGLVFYITIEYDSDAIIQLYHGLYLQELKVARNQDIDISYAEVYALYESLRHRE